MDPVEVRQKNLIPPFENGHNVVTGLTYDSGNYQAASTKALDHVDYEQLRQEQARGAQEGPVSRHRRRVVRRDLRPRTVAGRRRDRLPGRTLGKRDRPLPSDRQGQRLHRRLAARPGRRDDVRADRGRRARRRRRRRQGGARRHRQDADGLGHVRQPHDGGRRRGAGPSRRARSRRRPSCSRRICSRPPSKTSTTPTASSSSRARPTRHKTIQDIALMAQRRVEHAAGHGGRPRSVEFYDPPNFIYPFGVARRGRRGRSARPATSI